MNITKMIDVMLENLRPTMETLLMILLVLKSFDLIDWSLWKVASPWLAYVTILLINAFAGAFVKKADE